MNNEKKPFVISAGRGIKAKVWTNDGEKGTWYNVTFARTYQDVDGKLHDADSFGVNDLLSVAWLAEKAFEYIKSQPRTAE